MIDHHVVLLLGEPAVQFVQPAQVAEGQVLGHQADPRAGQLPGDPVEYGHRFPGAPRQYQVAHDGAPAYDAAFVQFHRAGLAQHLLQRGPRKVEIIPCGGVFSGGDGAYVLQIGQVDLYFPLEAP